MPKHRARYKKEEDVDFEYDFSESEDEESFVADDASDEEMDEEGMQHRSFQDNQDNHLNHREEFHRHQQAQKQYHGAVQGDYYPEEEEEEEDDDQQVRRSRRATRATTLRFRDPDSDDDDFKIELSLEEQVAEAEKERRTALLKPIKTVEKILWHRWSKKAAEAMMETGDEVTALLARSKKNEKDRPAIFTETSDYEYLVKWQGRSFIHLEWVPRDEIFRESRGKQKVMRYMRECIKLHPQDRLNEETFSTDCLVVERVLDEVDKVWDWIPGSAWQRADLVNQGRESEWKVPQVRRQYLVKWLGLGYGDCTWEVLDDLDESDFLPKVEEFRARNTVPHDVVEAWSRNEIAIPPNDVRPPPNSFRELTSDDLNFKQKQFKLRSYQLEGLNWLRFNWYQRRNSILADEMGLGKTVQTASMLHYLHQTHGMRGPFLIVAPLSTIPHWQREIEGWTHLNAVVYHGRQPARRLMWDSEFWYNQPGTRTPMDHIPKFNVLITTPQMVLQDTEFLAPIRWKYLAVDEAHCLKNKKGRLATELRKFNFDHCLLLSGTPLQNNTEELWSLLNFMDPRKFELWEDFDNEFGELTSADQVDRLHSVLKPMMLRRMKEDVEKSLKPKAETLISVELTTIQAKYYRAIWEGNVNTLLKGVKTKNLPNLTNVMLELRKTCNHPYLVNGVEESILREKEVKTAADAHRTLVLSSGKMVALDKLLTRLKRDGHRVLIFSQMTRVLDILEDYLDGVGHKFERIDGGVRGDKRQEAIDRFCKKDSDRFCFLLCTRAAGQGINLTAADTVIIFDSDWNPQGDLQAQARCHRIGQTKEVRIYRLITANTYERRIFDAASRKLGLDRAVLQTMTKGTDGSNFGDKSNLLTQKKEVEDWLKHGVYGLMNQDEAASEAFVNLSLDEILEKRSTVVGGDNPNAKTGLAHGGSGTSVFSRASFDANANAEITDFKKIDISDKGMWSRLLKSNSATPSDHDFLLPKAEREASSTSSSRERSERTSRRAQQRIISATSTSSINPYAGTHERMRGSWKSQERQSFLRAFQIFGYGRWDKIKEECGTDKSVKECRNYGQGIVAQIVSTLLPENSVRNLEMRNQVVSTMCPYVSFYATRNVDGSVIPEGSLPMDCEGEVMEPCLSHTDPSFMNIPLDASLRSNQFCTQLQKSAKAINTRLGLLHVINSACQMAKDVSPTPWNDLQIPVVGAERPVPWWGVKQDRHVIWSMFLNGEHNREQAMVGQCRNIDYLMFKYHCGPVVINRTKNQVGVKKALEGTGPLQRHEVGAPDRELGAHEKVEWPGNKLVRTRIMAVVKTARRRNERESISHSGSVGASGRARATRSRRRRERDTTPMPERVRTLAKETPWTPTERLKFVDYLASRGMLPNMENVSSQQRFSHMAELLFYTKCVDAIQSARAADPTSGWPTEVPVHDHFGDSSTDPGNFLRLDFDTTATFLPRNHVVKTAGQVESMFSDVILDCAVWLRIKKACVEGKLPPIDKSWMDSVVAGIQRLMVSCGASYVPEAGVASLLVEEAIKTNSAMVFGRDKEIPANASFSELMPSSPRHHISSEKCVAITNRAAALNTLRTRVIPHPGNWALWPRGSEVPLPTKASSGRGKKDGKGKGKGKKGKVPAPRRCRPPLHFTLASAPQDPELPTWWNSNDSRTQLDVGLMYGVAKYGLGTVGTKAMCQDPDLPFKAELDQRAAENGGTIHSSQTVRTAGLERRFALLLQIAMSVGDDVTAPDVMQMYAMSELPSTVDTAVTVSNLPLFKAPNLPAPAFFTGDMKFPSLVFEDEFNHSLGRPACSIMAKRSSNGIALVTVGNAKVTHLGQICDHPQYYNERHLVPIGYAMEKEYNSTINSDKRTLYSCWITLGPKGGPEFHARGADFPPSRNTIKCDTPSAVWRKITEDANKIRKKDSRRNSNNISGYDMYLLNHDRVLALLQDLPGVEYTTFRFQDSLVTEALLVRGESLGAPPKPKRTIPVPHGNPEYSDDMLLDDEDEDMIEDDEDDGVPFDQYNGYDSDFVV